MCTCVSVCIREDRGAIRFPEKKTVKIYHASRSYNKNQKSKVLSLTDIKGKENFKSRVVSNVRQFKEEGKNVKKQLNN